MNLGEVLKQLRIEKGLTQQELGEAIGKSKQMIINYEKNKTNIPMNVLKNIAIALDTSIDSILISITNKTKSTDVSINDIGIFLSFFGYTLLPDSSKNKIIFLDKKNRKYILNNKDFKQLLEFLKHDFKEWLSRILVNNYFKEKIKTIDTQEEKDIFDIIWDASNKK